MSWKASAWALECGPKSTTHRFVLVALANFADQEHNTAWPSVATLCGLTCLSERAVRQAIAELLSGGWITPAGKHENGRADKVTKRYRIECPEFEQRGALGAPRTVSRGAAGAESGVQQVHPNLSGESAISDLVPTEPARAAPLAPSWSKEACDDWI